MENNRSMAERCPGSSATRTSQTGPRSGNLNTSANVQLKQTRANVSLFVQMSLLGY